jgi:hypothetical protein
MWHAEQALHVVLLGFRFPAPPLQERKKERKKERKERKKRKKELTRGRCPQRRGYLESARWGFAKGVKKTELTDYNLVYFVVFKASSLYDWFI